MPSDRVGNPAGRFSAAPAVRLQRVEVEHDPVAGPLGRVREAAHANASEVMLVGILPTLAKEHLGLDSLTGYEAGQPIPFENAYSDPFNGIFGAFAIVAMLLGESGP